MVWWLEDATSSHFGWVRFPSEATFYIFLESRKKQGKNQKFRKISVFSRKYRVFSGNIGKSMKNRRFFADFFINDISFSKSFPTQPKTDFSPKNRPKKPIFWSLTTLLTKPKGMVCPTVYPGPSVPAQNKGPTR